MFDIAFASSAGNADVFASVGADGSVRMFDLRNLEHSTIIYETSDEKPLLRLSWNKQDPNYLATFQMDDMKVIILDIRLPSVPAAELTGHTACLNSLAWAPHSSTHICTAADDKNALIWDIGRKPVTGTLLFHVFLHLFITYWSLANGLAAQSLPTLLPSLFFSVLESNRSFTSSRSYFGVLCGRRSEYPPMVPGAT